ATDSRNAKKPSSCCGNAWSRHGRIPAAWLNVPACLLGLFGLDSRYPNLMPKKDSKLKARPPGDKWFVYILRCADGSLYTGITKDKKRRCQQHNDGTASRYTRSRRPTKLVWQEVQPSRSSALKREAAIKAMTRGKKMALIRLRKKAG